MISLVGKLYEEKDFNKTIEIKKFEFRKRAFRNTEVHTVVVYSTMPVGRIIGEFAIKHIHQDSPESIWSKTKRFSGVDESFFLMNIMMVEI